MDNKKAYLIIPKLIEQPTWGGEYILRSKQWNNLPFAKTKIGQSYELFSGSNISLLTQSQNPAFSGECTTSKNAADPTSLPNSVSLKSLIDSDPQKVLGQKYFEQFGPSMRLLIKFTQALGNSFQIHLQDGQFHPKWQPKPESWYYFEPGIVTLGIKKGIQWDEYEKVCVALNQQILDISLDIKEGIIDYEQAKRTINEVTKKYDPWQFVNLIYPRKESLIDLSHCGIHHSWEEDTAKLPLGNVLYELQLEVMDDVATIRSFDKGKLDSHGNIRSLHIEDYFSFIDRDAKINDPTTHMIKPHLLSDAYDHTLSLLLKTKYYQLKKLELKEKTAKYWEKISTFRHVFVKEGDITLSTSGGKLHVGQGHSAFIPAGVYEYEITSLKEPCIVLISH